MNKLKSIRHLVLDMDGTIYKGNKVFPSTVPFLDLLRDLDIGYTFLTNNPSKSTQDYLKHLSQMGIQAGPEALYTSTQAMLKFLQEKFPKVRRLFALGTSSMHQEFERAGFELLSDDPRAEPDAVIVGFDTTLTYSRLCRAAWWIKQGKPFIATNPDRVCPTDEETVLVDCGSICAALQTATGIAPRAVMGKPDPTMLTGILEKHSLRPEQLAMVGDRLYTDIVMAHRAGAVSVLVLSGESTVESAAQFKPAPDLVVADLSALGQQLRLALSGK